MSSSSSSCSGAKCRNRKKRLEQLREAAKDKKKIKRSNCSPRYVPLNKVRKSIIVKAGVLIIIFFMITFLIGYIGFSYLFNLNAVDSIVATSFYISGLGPIEQPVTDGQKLFSSLYAIVGGFIFLAIGAYLWEQIITTFFFQPAPPLD